MFGPMTTGCLISLGIALIGFAIPPFPHIDANLVLAFSIGACTATLVTHFPR